MSTEYPIIPVADSYKEAVQKLQLLQSEYQQAHESLVSLEVSIQALTVEKDRLQVELLEVASR